MGRKRNPKNINKYSKPFKNLRKVYDQDSEIKFSYQINIDGQEDFKEGDMYGIYDKKTQNAFGFGEIPIIHDFIMDKGKIKSISTYHENNEINPKNDRALIMGNINDKIR